MAKSKNSSGKKLLLKQTRSAIGRDKKFRGTLCALGLGRVGNKQSLPDNASVRGMIARVECVLDSVITE